MCAAAQCVECGSNSDCVDGAFCCQGICRPAADIEERCGCGASPTASAGETCTAAEVSNALCLVGDTVATPDNVAQGVCGCGCTPAEGGPICAAPEAAGAQPVCSCSGDNNECKRAAVDTAGRPHRVADICTPDLSCVCFSLGTADVCDPDGPTPDCASSGGCQSFVDDPQNCGKPARSCTAAETGIPATGACLGGGCSCDDPTDCRATGLNVDNCAFPGPGRPLQCVCDDFSADGFLAPCPMELACVAGGCLLDGTAFSTDVALRAALGLP